jgi:mannan endo-1,4-beta-mannosidase
MKGLAVPLAWFVSQANANIGNIKRVTNCNTIRVVMATSTADADWQTCVQNCINNKVIAEVELHDVTCGTDANGLNNMANWWVSKASYLNAHSKYILINLANEWGDWAMANSNQVAWYNAYVTAVKTMRNGGLNGTLVIDAPDCGQDLKNGSTLRAYAVALQNADPQHNLLFTVHLYGEWASGGGSQITSGLAQIKNAGIPLIVGEFSSSVDYASVVSTCNSNGIGIMAWSWIGNNDATLDMSNDWAGTSLKAWGSTIINNSGGIKSASQCSVFN